jgi:succinate dehydrogenase / fumarate reductase, flavoprotein subunit
MLMCKDALEREESCGGHFRAEYQDDEGEASATTTTSPTSRRGSGAATDVPRRAPRTLEYEVVQLQKRSYK